MQRSGLAMRPLTLTFLGTCSGGGPTRQRNCTSTALNLEQKSWLIDCAEGTQHQMMQQNIKPSRVDKVFITHMHVDHVFGLIPLMSTVMFALTFHEDPNLLRLQLYGPAGLRRFVRSNLTAMSMKLGGKYATHELLRAGDIPTPCSPEDLHENEDPGRDIFAADNGTWPTVENTLDGWHIAAGPLVHRVPSLGYVFNEPPEPVLSPEYVTSIHSTPYDLLPLDPITTKPMSSGKVIGLLIQSGQPVALRDGTLLQPPPLAAGRKVAILGDTCDASGMTELAHGADVVVHEATNAPKQRKNFPPQSEEVIREKAVSRGHSTPTMAGEFARAIGAKRLVMNHFSSAFAPPSFGRSGHRTDFMQQLEEQALQAFNPSGPSNSVIAAFDGLTIQVGTPLSNSPSLESSTGPAIQPEATLPPGQPSDVEDKADGRHDAPEGPGSNAPGSSQHSHSRDSASDILDHRLSAQSFSRTSRNQAGEIEFQAPLSPAARPFVPPPSVLASLASAKRSPPASPTNVPGQSRSLSTSPHSALASAKARRAQRWADQSKTTPYTKPSGSRTQLPIDTSKDQIEPDPRDVDEVNASIFGPSVQSYVRSPGLSDADKQERRKFVTLLKDELERGQPEASSRFSSQQPSGDVLEENQNVSGRDDMEVDPLGLPETTKVREEIVEDRDAEGNVVQRRRKVSLEGQPPIPRLPPQYRG